MSIIKTSVRKKSTDLKTRVEKVVAREIRPMLKMDGGDIVVHEITSRGEVKVSLKGACVGCPMAQMTLEHGVEEVLKEHIPEVKKVIRV